MLPVPCNKLIIPVVPCDSQSPPYRPMVDVPDELNILRDFICSSIVNAAGLLANNNAGRRFCYNMLAHNYWANPDFDEVYVLVCGLIIYRYQNKMLYDIKGSVASIVDQVLAGYAAYLVNNYDDVRKELNINEQKAVRELTNDFMNVKAMVTSAFNKLDRSDYAQRAFNILDMSRDVYTLDSKAMMANSHRAHTDKYMQPQQVSPSYIATNTNHQGYSVNNNQNRKPYFNGVTNENGTDVVHLTSEIVEYGVPVPEDYMIIDGEDGFDANFPDLGWFPSWHPKHVDWQKKVSDRYRQKIDKINIHEYETRGIPLPPHLEYLKPQLRHPLDSKPGYIRQADGTFRKDPNYSGLTERFKSHNPHNEEMIFAKTFKQREEEEQRRKERELNNRTPPCQHSSTPSYYGNQQGIVQPVQEQKLVYQPPEPVQTSTKQSTGYVTYIDGRKIVFGYEDPEQQYQPLPHNADGSNVTFMHEGYNMHQQYQSPYQQPQVVYQQRPQVMQQPQQVVYQQPPMSQPQQQQVIYVDQNGRPIQQQPQQVVYVDQQGYPIQQQPMPHRQQIQYQTYQQPVQQNTQYSPNVQVSRVLEQYNNGDRLVLTPQGQRVHQQLLMAPNLQSAISNRPVTFMQPNIQNSFSNPMQDPAACKMSSISKWNPKNEEYRNQAPVPRKPNVDNVHRYQQYDEPEQQYYQQEQRPTTQPLPRVPPRPTQQEDRFTHRQVSQSIHLRNPEDEYVDRLISEVNEAPNFHEVLEDQLPFEQNVQYSNGNTPIEVYTVNYFTEIDMDREAHKISKFGNKGLLDALPRYMTLNENVQAFSQKPAVVPKPEPIFVEDVETKEMVEQPVVELNSADYEVMPEYSIASDLNTAFTVSKIAMLDHQKIKPEDTVFRNFAVSGNLYLSNIDLNLYFETLKLASNLDQLASEIKRLSNLQIDSLKQKSELINALATINNALTKRINFYLKYRLKLALDIDDFAADYRDLINHLRNNHGDQFLKGLRELEMDIIDNFKSDISEEDVQYIKKGLRLSDELYMHFLPSILSFTHINRLSEELGLKINDESGTYYAISAQSTPVLYNLYVSLRKHKVEKSTTTESDYLILSDGNVFKFVDYVFGNNEFGIVRIN